MEKIDYKKAFKNLYGATSKEVQFVDVPVLNYLMVQGKGEPGGQPYIEAIQALYPLAYTIKFSSKKNLNLDYVVPPLEGLWWADDMADFIDGHRERWQWAMMIMQPTHVTKEMVDEAIVQVRTKNSPVALEKVEFLPLNEGKCAQILHIGPFSEEGPTIQKVHNAIESEGYSLAGKHHEIYLSDMRKISPDKYRTIIRQPLC